jgi:outer membrane protein W
MNVTRILTALVAAGFVAGTAMAQTAAAPVATKTAPAQDEAFLSQGTILYGGSMGWTMLSDLRDGGDTGKQESFDLAPEINYFVIDNLSLGLAADVNWQRTKYYGWRENDTTLIGNLVGRYYVPLCNNRIIPYVGATLGGGYGAFNGQGGGFDDHNDAFLTSWGAQTGFLVPLSTDVMLNTCVSYTRIQRQGNWNSEYNDTWKSRDEADVMLKMGFLIKL